MITVNAGCTIVVEHPTDGSLAFPAGVWQFDRVTSVRGTTNEVIDRSGLVDGAVLLVDINGWQTVSTTGVNLAGPAALGLISALMTEGLLLALRYVIRFISGSLGGGTVELFRSWPLYCMRSGRG